MSEKAADARIEQLEKENKENKEENKKLRKENKELKNEIGECHGLMDEIDFWKREAKRLGWKPNLKKIQ